jgi:hypothetical protein
MISADFFDKIEEFARKIRQNSEPFGGIQVNFIDFLIFLNGIKKPFFFFLVDFNWRFFSIASCWQNSIHF